MSLNVLLVDEELVSKELAAALQDEGLKVDNVESIPEALNKLSQNRYDIVVLEPWIFRARSEKNQHPFLSLLVELKQRGTPTIILSGQEEQILKEYLGLKEGVDYNLHCLKPLPPKDLANSVRNLHSAFSLRY